MPKRKKSLVEIKLEKDCIWVNGFWVLDASTFKEDYTLTIDTRKFKVTSKDKNHTEFTLLASVLKQEV